VVLATRSGEPVDPSPGSPAVLDLTPLTEQHALAAVHAMLPGANPFLARQIVAMAGGNPLFLEELCHFSQFSRSADTLPSSVRGPAWLEGVIAARLSRLGPQARHVLDCAATIGTQVPRGLLAGLSGHAMDAPAVALLAQEDVLVASPGDDVLCFKHGLTREVAYGSIGLETRRALHRQLAALLEAQGQTGAYELLAYHHGGAGHLEQSARYAALAGDRALSMSAIDRAKRHYRDALAAIERLGLTQASYGTWRSVVRRHGLAYVFDPGPQDVALFERAVGQAGRWGDTRGAAYAAYWLAYAHYALGAARPAVDACAIALKASQASDDAELAAQVVALHGQALAAQGHPDATVVLADALERLSRLPAQGLQRQPTGVSYTLACRASAVADRQGLDAALPAFAEALARVPASGHEVHGSVLCLQSNALLWHGRWDEAAQAAETATRVASGVRSLYLLAMGSALKAWADWQRLRDPAALHALEVATQWLEANGKRLFLSLNHGRLAQACAQTGHEQAARRHAVRALRRYRQGDPFGAPDAWRALALLAWREGRPTLAARRLDRADQAAQARGAGHEAARNAHCRVELGLN
jgi:hypothetical protein